MTIHGNLFHYSSLEGGLGILRSGELWLTDLSMTNDPRELMIGRDDILSAIRSMRSKSHDSEVEIFLEHFEDNWKSYIENKEVFGACLTPFGDMLPMWQLYADQGSGLSVGFRATAISNMVVRVGKVNYRPSFSEASTANFITQKMMDLLEIAEDPTVEEMLSVGRALLEFVIYSKHYS